MDAEFTRSEHYQQGSIRVLAEYSNNINSFNVVHVGHYSAPGSFRAPTHWTCPHYNDPKFIPQEETIRGILSRPSKTLAELRDNNFDGIAFYGPSGAGKTQVAIQFIHYYRRHTYDVFWVDASTPTTLAKDFQHISDLLEDSTSTHTNFPHRAGGGALPFARSTDERITIPKDPTSETTAMKNTDNSIISSQESLLSTVKSKLESPSADDWLLVLDNLTDETAIARFLPKSSNGIIIVTTRSLHLASGLGCRVVEVPRMSPTNALSLFKRIYHDSEESGMKREDVMELMELLEYLPAKIADAVLRMRENRVSVREYLAELKKGSRSWACFGFDGMYGCWKGAVAWGCFVVFSVLLAWAIGFLRGW